MVTVDLKDPIEVTELKKWRPGTAPARRCPPRSTARTQKAADTACSAESPGMLVAVQASTGEVLAVASTKEYTQEKDALAREVPRRDAPSRSCPSRVAQGRDDPKQKLACPPPSGASAGPVHQAGPPSGATPTFQDNFANGLHDRVRLAVPRHRRPGPDEQRGPVRHRRAVDPAAARPSPAR